MIDWSKYPIPKRIRHHLSANQYMPLSEKNINTENYPPIIDKVDWTEIFENTSLPVHLDIGCGYGHFLMDYAKSNPYINILGIEIRPGPIDYIKEIIEKEEISNCSILWYNVANRLDFINDKSIKEIYYFFPDPWFKKKHHKRRAFNMSFLNDCHRILEDNSSFYIQTDIEEVHKYHLELLNKFTKFDFKELDKEEKWELPTTNKEKECIRRGFDYWRIKAVKTISK